MDPVGDPVGDLPSGFRLDGRVAVVIGGTGALCGRMAETLSEAGARTVIVGRDRAKGERVLDRARPGGGGLSYEPCDVTSRAELRSLVARVLASHGRVDVLVNGAGVNSATPFLEISDEEIEQLDRCRPARRDPRLPGVRPLLRRAGWRLG